MSDQTVEPDFDDGDDEDDDLELGHNVEGDEPEFRSLDEVEADADDLGAGEEFADDMPKADMARESWEGDPIDRDGDAGLVHQGGEEE